MSTFRNRKTQDWSIGATVRVGFLTLTVIAKKPTAIEMGEDQRPYLLRNAKGDSYIFTPHHGLYKIQLGDAPIDWTK